MSDTRNHANFKGGRSASRRKEVVLASGTPMAISPVSGGSSGTAGSSGTFAMNQVSHVNHANAQASTSAAMSPEKRAPRKKYGQGRMQNEVVVASGIPVQDGAGSMPKAINYVLGGKCRRKEVIFASGTVPLLASMASSAQDGEEDDVYEYWMRMPMPRPQVVNVTSSVDLSVPLDLALIAKNAVNVEYNPIYSPSLTLRARKPVYTMATIQASGKMVVIGGTSRSENHAASRKYGKLIYKYLHPFPGNNIPKFRNYQVTNVFAKTETRFPINLPELASDRMHLHQCVWDSETTTGAIYRIENPKVSANIFHNGKVTLKGAKSRADIIRAFEILYPILKQFRKK